MESIKTHFELFLFYIQQTERSKIGRIKQLGLLISTVLRWTVKQIYIEINLCKLNTYIIIPLVCNKYQAIQSLHFNIYIWFTDVRSKRLYTLYIYYFQILSVSSRPYVRNYLWTPKQNVRKRIFHSCLISKIKRLTFLKFKQILRKLQLVATVSYYVHVKPSFSIIRKYRNFIKRRQCQP